MSDTNPYLLLGRSLPERTITVDVWVDAFPPPAWVGHAVDVLTHVSNVRLRRIVVASLKRKYPAQQKALASRYASFCGEHCEFLKPFTGKQGELRQVSVVHEDSMAVGEMRETLPDVVVHIGNNSLIGDCVGISRECVWSVIPGDPESRSALLFSSEIIGSSPVLPICLMHHSVRWEAGRVLYRYQAPKSQSFYYLRTAEYPLTAVGALVARKLHDWLVQGAAMLDKAAGPEISALPRSSGPSLALLGTYLAGRIGHSLLSRTLNRKRRKQWFVAWRDQKELFTAANRRFQPSGFHDFRGRPNMGYADPFPFRWKGKDLLFIEEILPDDRGRLVVTEIRDGKEDEQPPVVILEKPYHLSYPNVFEHDGEHFLIPETCANQTVDLYRATRFPYEWVHHKRLIEGMALVDTTPFFRDGLWYFFVTTWDLATVPIESFLYFSEKLDGPWRYHRANPISSDARKNRSAGRLFLVGDTLIRPVQDCAIDYGSAIRLMAVEKLTPDDYSEKEIAYIAPHWHPKAVRTHTLVSSEGLEAIDGWPRTRLSLPGWR